MKNTKNENIDKDFSSFTCVIGEAKREPAKANAINTVDRKRNLNSFNESLYNKIIQIINS